MFLEENHCFMKRIGETMIFEDRICRIEGVFSKQINKFHIEDILIYIIFQPNTLPCRNDALPKPQTLIQTNLLPAPTTKIQQTILHLLPLNRQLQRQTRIITAQQHREARHRLLPVSHPQRNHPKNHQKTAAR